MEVYSAPAWFQAFVVESEMELLKKCENFLHAQIRDYDCSVDKILAPKTKIYRTEKGKIDSLRMTISFHVCGDEEHVDHFASKTITVNNMDIKA